MKNLKASNIFNKTLVLSTIRDKCGRNNNRISKEGESIGILKILGLINNINEYYKCVKSKKFTENKNPSISQKNQ